MITKTVSLNTIVDVKEFVNIVARYEFEVDLVSGRYHIDGKSIMGIFSLDQSNPLQLQIEDWKEDYMSVVEKYLYT